MAQFLVTVNLEVDSEDEDGIEVAPPSTREVTDMIVEVLRRAFNTGRTFPDDSDHTVSAWYVSTVDL